MGHHLSSFAPRKLGMVAVATLLCSGLALPSPAVSAAAEPVGVNDCHSTDNGDPRLVEFHYGPARVDVLDSSADVQFRVRARDTGGPGPASGVRGVSVWFGKGPGDESFGTEIRPLADAGGGWWAASFTIPRRSPHEMWPIEGLDIRDRAGNGEHYSRAELQEFTGRRLNVAITSAADRSAPRLTAFSVTPDSIDTTSEVRYVTFTARMVDRQSDVTSGVVAEGRGDTSWLAPETGSISLDPVPGTRHLFSARVPIPRWVGNREWRTAEVWAWNSADQAVLYNRRQLTEMGFNGDFSVVSGTDTVRPEVRSFEASARSVDVRTEDAAVSFTVRATDVGSGVQRVVVSSESQEEFWLDLARTSGTARDGIWTGTLNVRHCRTATATWRLAVTVYDDHGDPWDDGVVYDAAELAAQGWQHRIRVTGGDIERPWAFAPSPVRASGPVRLTFTEPVQGIDMATASLHRIRADGSLGKARAGTWRCFDGAGARTSCRSGSVEEARFRPDSPLRAATRYGLAVHPEHQLGITDLAGNPVRQEVWRLRVKR